MVKRYHRKRGSDDDTVALTTIDSEQQSTNSEPEYEFKQVKWKDFVTKKKYIRTSSLLEGYQLRGIVLTEYSMVDTLHCDQCIGWIDDTVSR